MSKTFHPYVRAKKQVVRDSIFCLRALTLFSEDRMVFFFSDLFLSTLF